MNDILLEVIADSVADARAIEEGGAQRIELVSALSEGGLTPSVGLIEQVVRAVGLPVHVMIRPHAQSFCYTPDDLAVMVRDIELAKQSGAAGVVFGALTKSGELDRAALQTLLSAAGKLAVTFHRAIDAARAPLTLAEELRQLPQVTRVLTAGGAGRIEDNCAQLKQLAKAGSAIIAGSGITLENVAAIIAASGVREIHVGTAVRAEKSPRRPVDALLVRQFCERIAQEVHG